MYRQEVDQVFNGGGANVSRMRPRGHRRRLLLLPPMRLPGRGHHRNRRRRTPRRHRQPPFGARPSHSPSPSPSQFWDSLRAVDDNVSARVKQEDGVGPTGPGDFGSSPMSLSYDGYYSEIRMRDVMGIHIMIQMQCKAWVEEFRVSPLICGLAGSIWLRFVALSGVFGDSWADETIYESESQKQGTING